MLNEIHMWSRSIHRGAGQASSESHVGEAQTLQSVIVFLARFAKVANSRNRNFVTMLLYLGPPTPHNHMIRTSLYMSVAAVASHLMFRIL